MVVINDLMEAGRSMSPWGKILKGLLELRILLVLLGVEAKGGEAKEGEG